MMSFIFIASADFDLTTFNNVERFIDSHPDFQAVILNDEHELNLLLKHMGLEIMDACEIINAGFTKY